MTHFIIHVILAYSEYLRRVEAHKLALAARSTTAAKAAYIHHSVNNITAERAALEAMIRVYMARTQVQPKRRTA